MRTTECRRGEGVDLRGIQALLAWGGSPSQVDGSLHCSSMWVIVRLQLLQQRLQHLIHLHCRITDELEHLHNAETRF